MKKIRHVLVLLCALYSVPSYSDRISVSIGIDFQEYPEFVLVPGYPVYYAPQLQANLFFYDGDYWIYQNDNWYQSSWYNGPWWLVDPEDVPEFILRVPVRYYLLPPIYFIGWWSDAPPRWGDHWGHDWEQHRHGWDKWDHKVRQKPAPLPLYQRQYSEDRYPRQEQQHELHYRNYRYQARDPLVQQHHHEQSVQGGPVQGGPVQRQIKRPLEDRGSMQPDDIQRPSHRQGDSNTPHTQSPQRGGVSEPGTIQVVPQQEHRAVQEHRQQPQPAAGQREQQMQRSQDRDMRQQDRESRQQGNDREQQRGQRQEQERGRDR